ncbi:unnamed protein product [Ambrosiozyma monospora]|uniref:Unnamed protein product n=1 Tax=Ambrosiozyma monospora TaxID=43982 RepID=A0ACB5TYF0_AMBMO|nr:unnamed protein product [Ambrosiozyma monospora]
MIRSPLFKKLVNWVRVQQKELTARGSGSASLSANGSAVAVDSARSQSNYSSNVSPGSLLLQQQQKTSTAQESSSQQPTGRYQQQQSETTSAVDLNIAKTVEINKSHEMGQKLSHFGFPPFATVTLLIDIFYKYCNPSHLALPNKSLFVDEVAFDGEYAALLAAMFTVAIKYVSANEVPDPKFLRESYWKELFEKHKSHLSVMNELNAMTITCHQGSDNQLLNCFKSIEVNNLLLVLKSKNNFELDNYLSIATEKQVIDKECLTRLVWNVYKFQNFRRISFGYPYKNGHFFKFPEHMELPMCDVDYYINSKDPSDFKKNYKKTVDLNQIDFRNPSPYLLHDALAKMF